MAAYVFPPAPTPGQKYPSPALAGASQYQWDNVVGVWNVIATFVKLNNPNAYNGYVWPATDGTAGQQLETDGAGNLSWQNAFDPSYQVIIIDPLTPFDGIQSSFSLVEAQIPFNVFTPTPSSNIQVFLGGVAQDPLTAYTIAGSVINFTNAPPAGTNFFAVSMIEV